MSVRWRGVAARRMSMLSDGNYAHSTIGEEAIMNELEIGNHYGSPIDFVFQSALLRPLSLVSWLSTEEQDLVKELVALSTPERVRAIRDLPRSFEEKKIIRWFVFTLSCSKLTITPC